MALTYITSQENDFSQYCEYCQEQHPLTGLFWRRLSSPQCRRYLADRARAWRQCNPEKVKQYRKDNRVTANHRERTARRKHPERYRQYDRNKTRSNTYVLALRLRQRLNSAVRKQYKTGSAVADLGCSIAELRAYLEAQFQPGMSWDNYGRSGWHIDHIRPLSDFDLADPTQLKQAVHFSNLQPLWAIDNLRKGSRVA